VENEENTFEKSIIDKAVNHIDSKVKKLITYREKGNSVLIIELEKIRKILTNDS